MMMRKWMFTALTAACLCCAAAGCAKKEAAAQNVSEGTQDAADGTQDAAEGTRDAAAAQTTGKNGTGRENGDGAGDGTDKAADAENAADTENAADAEKAADVSPEQSENTAVAQANDGSTVNIVENQSGTGAPEGKTTPDSGYVTEIHDQYFTVSLIHNEVIDGGLIAVFSTENEELAEIYYTGETVFKILEVKNAGQNAVRDVTEKAASIKELKPDDMVSLEGGWDGDKYKAETVSIYHFM